MALHDDIYLMGGRCDFCGGRIWFRRVWGSLSSAYPMRTGRVVPDPFYAAHPRCYERHVAHSASDGGDDEGQQVEASEGSDGAGQDEVAAETADRIVFEPPQRLYVFKPRMKQIESCASPELALRHLSAMSGMDALREHARRLLEWHKSDMPSDEGQWSE